MVSRNIFVETVPVSVARNHPSRDNKTFNSAATTIIEQLQNYPKGTPVGFGFAMYGPNEMHRITYRSIFDLRSIATPVLALIRDFFIDSKVTREELGDESLDHVAHVKPVGISGSELYRKQCK